MIHKNLLLSVALSLTTLPTSLFANTEESVLDEINQNFATTGSDVFRIDEKALFAPSTESDSDMGEHLILSSIPNKGIFTVDWHNRFIHSDNVGNTNSQAVSGFIFNSNLRLNWNKLVGKNLFFDLDFVENRFQFESENDFDFSSSRWGVGLTKIIEGPDIALSANLFYHYARRNFISDEIYGTSSGRVSIGRTFYLNPNNISFIAAEADFALTSTEQSVKKNSYSIRVGHTLRLHENTFLTGFTNYSMHDYTADDRSDKNLVTGLSLEHKMSDTWTAGASFSYTNNDSSVNNLSYSSMLSSV